MILKHYGSYTGEETFKIYKGISASGVLILTVAGTTSQSSTDQSQTVCCWSLQLLHYLGNYGAEGEYSTNEFLDGTYAANPEATSTSCVSAKIELQPIQVGCFIWQYCWKV